MTTKRTDNDKKEQTTATEEADPYGMTTKRTDNDKERTDNGKD
jgi:hypothetical protein